MFEIFVINNIDEVFNIVTGTFLRQATDPDLGMNGIVSYTVSPIPGLFDEVPFYINFDGEIHTTQVQVSSYTTTSVTWVFRTTFYTTPSTHAW